nr:hypothetical protein [uncultured Mucilaginibacter sp.]
MANKTCLLIIPKKFYSFEKHITNALKRKNYDVTVANDEYPEGVVGKVMGKLRLPFLFSITYNTITRNFLEGKTYDIAIIFKGRGISERLITEMKKSVNEIVAYNWDSFKYNPNPLKWYRSVNRYYTFDYNDAEKYNIPAVPLFTSDTAPVSKSEIKYDLSYIVRNHSERLIYINDILEQLKPERTFIYIYELNVFTFFANFLKNPKLYLKLKKYIFNTPLKYQDYTDAIKHSRVTIDYAHSDQTGITMRCFEAIKMGVKIITNNKYIQRSDSFNASNTVVYNIGDDKDYLVDGYRRLFDDASLSKNRDIDGFIDDLLKK